MEGSAQVQIRPVREPGAHWYLAVTAAAQWQTLAIKALSALLNGTKKRRIND